MTSGVGVGLCGPNIMIMIIMQLIIARNNNTTAMITTTRTTTTTTNNNNAKPWPWEKATYGQSPYYHYGFQRVWLKHNLNSKGWNSKDQRAFPGKFESSNLSRDNVSREIGRIADCYFNVEINKVWRESLRSTVEFNFNVETSKHNSIFRKLSCLSFGGAPRSPVPRNHFSVWIVKSPGCHCTDVFGENDIAECPPLLGARPILISVLTLWISEALTQASS